MKTGLHFKLLCLALIHLVVVCVSIPLVDADNGKPSTVVAFSKSDRSSGDNSLKLDQMRDVSYSIRQLKAKKKRKSNSEVDSLSPESEEDAERKETKKRNKKVKLRDGDDSYASEDTAEQSVLVEKKIKTGKRASRKNRTIDSSEEGSVNEKEDGMQYGSEDVDETAKPKKRKKIRDSGVLPKKKKKTRVKEPVMDDVESGKDREERKPIMKEMADENEEDNSEKRNKPIEKESVDQEEEEKSEKRSELTEEEEKEKPVKRSELTEEETGGENESVKEEEKQVKRNDPTEDEEEEEEEKRKSGKKESSEEEEENEKSVMNEEKRPVKRSEFIEEEEEKKSVTKEEERKPVKKSESSEDEEEKSVEKDDSSEEEEEEEKPVKRNEPIEEPTEDEEKDTVKKEEEVEKPVEKDDSSEEEEEEEKPVKKEEEEEEEKSLKGNESAKEEEKSVEKEESDEEEVKEEAKPENSPIDDEEEEEKSSEVSITTPPKKQPPQGIPHRESVKIEDENEETKPSTLQPIFETLKVETHVIGNRIAIIPSFKTVSSMKLFCTIILLQERMSPAESLMYRVPLLGQDLKDTKGQNTLYLVTADLRAVKSVGCMGYSAPNIYYGPLEIPVVVEPPPAPDISTRIIEQTPLSLEVYVKSSMEARVWCKIMREALPEATIDLIQTGVQRMVRRRASLYFKDLTPNTDYHIWCYGESKEGTPMKQSLNEVKLTTHTLESYFQIESLTSTTDRISFRLRSNMGREALCIVRNDQGQQIASQTVSVHKNDQLSFRDLPSHRRFYLNCLVHAKKGENSNPLGSVLADTGTKEVMTKRSVLSTLLSVIMVLMVIMCILFAALQFIRTSSPKQKMGLQLRVYDPEKQLLLDPDHETPQSAIPVASDSSEATWRCAACQYLNHGSGDRCIMCSVSRAGGVGSDKPMGNDSSFVKKTSREMTDTSTVDIKPVIRTSKIGVGMKLKKNMERRSLPKKQSTPDPKVEPSDIFSEVGLDVKMDVSSRSQTMLNKSLTPSTVHVKPSSVLTMSDEEEEMSGDGWNDGDLDL